MNGDFSFSFDPFQSDSVQERDYGEGRGILPAALGAALGFLALTLILILALGAMAGQLAPLQEGDADMRRFALEGHFPLVHAAHRGGREALAAGANAQTMFGLAFIAGMAVWFARAGFVSQRIRGWSNWVWVAGVCVICFAPTLSPGLTPQKIDYLVTSNDDGSARRRGAEAYVSARPPEVSPRLSLLERGLFLASLGLMAAYVFHDAGYRAREAMGEFGLMEEREEPAPRTYRAGGSGGGAKARGKGAESGGGHNDFGQRSGSAGPQTAPLSDDARARQALGVSLSASRREIERAYKTQMKRAHPDHGGSVARAAALNAARDVLLRKRK